MEVRNQAFAPCHPIHAIPTGRPGFHAICARDYTACISGRRIGRFALHAVSNALSPPRWRIITPLFPVTGHKA